MFGPGTNADLLHAQSYARHRLPIIRLQPTLHAPELEPCNLPDIVREALDRLPGVPEPDQGLLAQGSVYETLYASVNGGSHNRDIQPTAFARG